MCFPLRLPVDLNKRGSRFDPIFRDHRRVYLLEKTDRGKKPRSLVDYNKKAVPSLTDYLEARAALYGIDVDSD
jgi:hypothetical protein